MITFSHYPCLLSGFGANDKKKKTEFSSWKIMVCVIRSWLHPNSKGLKESFQNF